MYYDETYYYYLKDVFGNITHVYDRADTQMAYYKYDAWGNCTVIQDQNDVNNVANINPFRYRGYYYDVETGYYYCNYRYYSPELCRFISPDSIDYLDPSNGLNLYCYCGNDPINRYDPSGHSWEWSNFWQAAGYLVTGISAIVAGALVIASGVATWPMLLVAGITIGAGALTTINGVAEVGDLAFDYNFIEDGLFGGNSSAYNTYATITGTIATVGSIACGAWYKYNTPRIKAYKNIGNYSYTNTTKKYFPNANIVMKGNEYRPYMQSTWAQKTIVKYGKMVKDTFGYMFILNNAEIGVNIVKELIWHMLIR